LSTALAEPLSRDIPPASIAAGLAVILWNYCGWDNISTYAHEVKDPHRNYPRTLAAALVIIILSYVFPLLAGFKATVTPSDWGNSSGWPAIASRLGGEWLGTSGALAALLSTWAMFNSQLLYVSRVPTVMARDGWIPRIFAQTSPKTGAPEVALVSVAFFAALFSGLSLGKLMVVDILFYTLGLSLEFIALIALREKEPGLKRPFRIPLGRTGLVLLAIPPLLLAVIVAVSSMMGTGGSFLQVGIVIAGIAAGLWIHWRKASRAAKAITAP
jgi:amino acid transporter